LFSIAKIRLNTMQRSMVIDPVNRSFSTKKKYMLAARDPMASNSIILFI
jgi:hypothetical protein